MSVDLLAWLFCYPVLSPCSFLVITLPTNIVARRMRSGAFESVLSSASGVGYKEFSRDRFPFHQRKLVADVADVLTKSW
jgi:hypothetical protein